MCGIHAKLYVQYRRRKLYVLFPQSLYSVYNFTSRHKPKEGGSNYVVCISVPYGQDKPLHYHSTNVKVCLN